MYYPYSMGETAENVAKQWKISRQEQDEFALSSQQKYFEALKNGKWKDEIVAIEIDERIKMKKFCLRQMNIPGKLQWKN